MKSFIEKNNLVIGSKFSYNGGKFKMVKERNGCDGCYFSTSSGACSLEYTIENNVIGCGNYGVIFEAVITPHEVSVCDDSNSLNIDIKAKVSDLNITLTVNGVEYICTNTVVNVSDSTEKEPISSDIKIHTFSVGDNVRIRSDLKIGEDYGKKCGTFVSFNSDMSRFKGMVARIIRPCNIKHIIGYHINLDNMIFIWTEEMFE